MPISPGTRVLIIEPESSKAAFYISNVKDHKGVPELCQTAEIALTRMQQDTNIQRVCISGVYMNRDQALAHLFSSSKASPVSLR